jgi:putative ABC transport system permease protein
LVRILGSFRASVGVSWRYGIANIARRGRESIVQVVAFGLGLMVLLLLAVVRTDLLKDWRASLPVDAPNHFLVNIRPDEEADVRALFARYGVTPPVLLPLVRGRLEQINGQPLDQHRMLFRNGPAADRELNLTYMKELPPDNKIVAGGWWKENDGGGPRVSIDNSVAANMHLKLGDKLQFDVADEKFVVTVSSIREIQWDSFRPNFFMTVSPGVLEEVTGTLVGSVHLEPGQRRALVELVRQFPEISVIDVDAILTQVRTVMDRASLAVQYVFVFTLFAGIAVLLAAIQSTRDERRYESAMLRTFGASRRVVLQGVAAEFASIGLLAGTLAAFGASVAGYFLATRVFNLAYSPNPKVWLLGLSLGALFVGVSGVLATRSVINTPPALTLR